MKLSQLVAEHQSAATELEKRGWDYLARYGFDRAAVAAAGFVGLARVAVEDDTMIYEPADNGVPAVILPVYAGAIGKSDLVDLAAWLPKEPESIARRAGFGMALGEDVLAAALEPDFMEETAPPPLRLFRTPARWAQARVAGVDGAVLLTWRAPQLLSLEAIIAEDVQHGDFIKTNLARLRAQLMKRLPEIRVPAVAAGAAA